MLKWVITTVLFAWVICPGALKLDSVFMDFNFVCVLKQDTQVCGA